MSQKRGKQTAMHKKGLKVNETFPKIIFGRTNSSFNYGYISCVHDECFCAWSVQILLH